MTARHALDWVLSIREPPSDAQVAAHFSPRFLTAVGADRLPGLLAGLVANVIPYLDSLEVTDRGKAGVEATLGQTEILVRLASDDPSRMDGLLFRRRTDPRLADPPMAATGRLGELASAAFRDDGHVGLSIHTLDGSTANSAVIGWADLPDGRALTADGVFPAYSITKLLTAVAVLQLDLDLEAPVAPLLHELRVPGDVTIRQLLTHHGGLSNDFSLWEDEVPDLVTLLGPEVAVEGPPGVEYAYSNAGFGVLGQLITDVTGRPYADVVTERVLVPLGMTSSSFPVTVPSFGVTLHEADDDGLVTRAEPKICTVPSAGGLWSTAADLARFGRDWARLLPADVAAAAISPQAPRGGGASIGFGFLLGSRSDRLVIAHAGGGIGASTSLLAMPEEGLVAITLANRQVGAEPVNFQALQIALEARG